MTVLENLTAAAFTVVALTLAILAFRAWWFTRSTKVLLLTIGFSLFLLKGLFFSFNLFTTPDWEQRSFIAGILIDIVALVCFYGAVFRPSGT